MHAMIEIIPKGRTQLARARKKPQPTDLNLLSEKSKDIAKKQSEVNGISVLTLAISVDIVENRQNRIMNQ